MSPFEQSAPTSEEVEPGIAPLRPRRLRSRADVEVLVRRAVPSDGAAILEIICLVTAEGFYFISQIDEINASAKQVEDWIESHLKRPGNTLLVAEVDGTVVGFVEFERGHRRRVSHMGQMSIYLRREYRDLGVGSLLLDTFLDWATRSPAIEKVCLSVFSTNQRAIGFYRKFGFLQEGRKIREYKLESGQYVDDLMLCRFVDADRESLPNGRHQ